MNCILESKSLTAHSLVWAAVMLLAGFLSQGQERAATILIFLIGGWFISQHFISKKGKRASCKNVNKFELQGEVNDEGK